MDVAAIGDRLEDILSAHTPDQAAEARLVDTLEEVGLEVERDPAPVADEGKRRLMSVMLAVK